MAHKPLPTYLRRFRLRLGLSHDEIAFLLGTVYGSNISKYESASRLPGVRTLLGLELVLGAPLRDLYEGTFWQVRSDLRVRLERLHAHIGKKPTNRRNKHKLQVLNRLARELDSES